MSEKKTILVVDDEQDITTYLTTLLEDNGYATLTATDGEKALELARTQNPDLITLDMSMPEKSGVKAFREFKTDAELIKIPVIIITGIGQSMKEFLERSRNAPEPDGFMAKPIEEDKLLEMVKNLLS